MGADAVQRSKLLQELTTVADGEGQQRTCTTFTLPCSADVFGQWHTITVAGAKQLSVEALCQVLQVCFLTANFVSPGTVVYSKLAITATAMHQSRDVSLREILSDQYAASRSPYRSESVENYLQY